MKIEKILLDNNIQGTNQKVYIDNNKVMIKPNTIVSKIEIEFKISLPEFLFVLGDAWERAYGDLQWTKPDGRIYPWYLQVINSNYYQAFGVKTGCNSFCHWLINQDSISLIIDVRCGTAPVKITELFEACEIVTMEEYTINVFKSSQKFCKEMCNNPLLPSEPIYGGNNWYYAYGKSSASQIMKDTERISKWSEGLINRPFMVIDAGWQPYMMNEEICSGGPYPHGNYQFSDMSKLAEKMISLDARPGIWYRPLQTAETLPEHWILNNRILDPTIPEVYELLKKDANRLHSWGYQLIKHDFSTYDIFGLWGYEMTNGITYKNQFKFHDDTKTTAQAIKLLYQAIYEGSEGSYIIGCNTVGHLATGMTHIQRIGDDTSGLEWDRTKKMGVNCLAFRSPQHNTFFSADADCIGITEKIPWRQNVEWLKLLASSGTPLFVSAEPKALTPEIEGCIIEAFKLASIPQEVLQPVDWFYNLTPAEWGKNDQTFSFKF